MGRARGDGFDLRRLRRRDHGDGPRRCGRGRWEEQAGMEAGVVADVQAGVQAGVEVNTVVEVE